MNSRRFIEILVAACTIIFLSVLALDPQETTSQITVARSSFIPDSVQILPLEQLQARAGERLQEFGVSGRAEHEEVSLITFGQWLTLTGHHVNFDMTQYSRDDPLYIYKGYGEYGWANGHSHSSGQFTEVVAALFAETGELREIKVYTPQGPKLIVDVNVEDTRQEFIPPSPPPATD